MRTSRDVRSGRSSRPRHRRVLYIPHRRLWILECSCKVWCRPCRRKPTPRLHSRLSWRLRNLAGKLVISAMKAMRMVNKGCDAFLASLAFIAQLSLRSPILDEVIEQQKADPRLLELVGKAGIARDEDGGSLDHGEGFPNTGLKLASTENQEEGTFGDFLGLPKESFNSNLDSFRDRNLASRPLAAKISSLRPTILPSVSLNGQTLPSSSLGQNSLVGDTPLEETAESYSEHGE
ncbi:hypothetical protein Taro_046312 [Colocasia esculenta]|uniref:Uncharacterized protein n=1 Tax=Colocasia esculenta TaxID=4460 RepID=A0A843WYY0_COLES|nr:hypothetical protein [Colocasia esculenta]